MKLLRAFFCGALLVALQGPPLPAYSQNVWSNWATLNDDGMSAAVVGEGPFSDTWPYGGWWIYWLLNNDYRGDSIKFFGLSHIPVPSAYLYADTAPGWTPSINDEDDGTSSIWWVAQPGYEGQPGSWVGFWVLGFSTWQAVDQGGWCVLGSDLGNCGFTQVPSW